MSTWENLTAGQFLRQFAASLNRVQLTLIALCETIAVLFEATLPLSFPLPAWAKIAAGTAIVIISHAGPWLALGSRRIQQWIMAGGRP